MIMLAQKIRTHGFALPTVLLASTILLTVLTVAVVAAASVNKAVSNVYYQQLAREAAESGLTYARYCYAKVGPTNIASNDNLTQSTDCTGSPISGQDCSTSPGTILCGVADTGSVRSQFSVPAPTSSSGSASYTVHATGTVQLLRKGNHTVYDTIKATLSQQVSLSLNGIASGNDTTCSIQAGQLYCWGKNTSGQVGNGTAGAPVTVPYHVQGFSVDGTTYNYVQYVATGIDHTCAVVGVSSQPSDGNRVFCWGDNSFGQFGDGSTTSWLTPEATCYGSECSGGHGLEGARYTGCTSLVPDCTPISARDHTCTIDILKSAPGSPTNDRVYCWGKNNYGQAGTYDSYSATPTIPDPKIYPGYAIVNLTTKLALRGVTSLGNVSGSGACTVSATTATDGAVYCWGTNRHGELGDGSYHYSESTPVATPAVVVTSGVTKVTTNNSRACAIKSGALYCWGGNGVYGGPPDYRLDSGSAASGTWHVETPIQLVSSTKYGGAVTDFAITDWNTCVVVNGKVYCSGYNDFGQLGQGTTGSYVAATNSDTGPVVGFGTATSPSQVRPASQMVQVKGALADQTVTEITSGNNHFCAITANHEAYCWGANTYGQLGDGTTETSATPTKAHVPATIIF